ncbi:AlpA family phage regulatory protein [Vibrio furnissii]|uniref:AlpA family phage regulatory protein n=1 Tax=Vibrio furnissii TaxID=29494 RepID=UPI0013021515
MCSSSIYNLINAGEFPQSVTVMGKRKAWLESEVEEWMVSKMESCSLRTELFGTRASNLCVTKFSLVIWTE